jgi:hypothetical protein
MEIIAESRQTQIYSTPDFGAIMVNAYHLTCESVIPLTSYACGDNAAGLARSVEMQRQSGSK